MDPNRLIFGEPISRRRAIGACGAAALGWFAGSARAQLGRGRAAVSDAPLRLERELENSKFIDISADSQKLCFYFSRRAGPYYDWNEKWQDASPIGVNEDALRVVLRDSWKMSYTKRLLGPASRGGFFAEGDRVYVETLPVMGRDSSIMQRLIVDIQTGKEQSRVEPVPKSGLRFSYWPLDGNRLLGEGRSFDTALTEVIVLAELPNYREIKRVPFLQARSGLARRDGTLTVSVNRKAFAYFYENEIVYGGTADLTPVWTKKAEPAVTVWDIAISPNGDFVALYASETQGLGQPQAHYAQILSAKDGSPIAKVPVDPLQALAISPDGKLLAAALRDSQRGFMSGVQPILQVFEVASGKRVSTVVVDQFKTGSGELFPVTALFTPDGTNLLTSARTTKVWDVG